MITVACTLISPLPSLMSTVPQNVFFASVLALLYPTISTNSVIFWIIWCFSCAQRDWDGLIETIKRPLFCNVCIWIVNLTSFLQKRCNQLFEIVLIVFFNANGGVSRQGKIKIVYYIAYNISVIFFLITVWLKDKKCSFIRLKSKDSFTKRFN